MKSVLISIQPKWCELIASGKKTVEVRKTRPKLETPFKCYIYETQGRTETPFVDEEGHHIFKGRGQVIGEFVCDRIVRFENKIYDLAFDETVDRACIEPYELAKYCLPQCYAYGWHISDLVIYDKPRELSEFYIKRYSYGSFDKIPTPLYRPPQSWYYIESEVAK